MFLLFTSPSGKSKLIFFPSAEYAEGFKKDLEKRGWEKTPSGTVVAKEGGAISDIEIVTLGEFLVSLRASQTSI